MTTVINATILSAASQASIIGSAFVRNIIFARLLSPEDFGLAMTFGLVLSLLEYASNLGHENLMLREKYGAYRNFQATLHSTMILRGVLLAVILLVAAPYIPTFFNLPTTSFNYAYLAVVPFIAGFNHLDFRRFQRNHNFLPSAKITIIADSTSILVAYITSITLDSYWAFYWSFVYRHSVGALLSHIWATRPYIVRWNKRHVSRLMRFGLPLVGVGILKYLSLQADKAIVLKHAGLLIFTSYSIALMVASVATNFVSLTLSQIFIRKIGLAQNDSARLEVIKKSGLITIYIISPILITLSLCGENIIGIIFGHKYSLPNFLLPVACSLVMLRAINNWLDQVTTATSRTSFLLAAYSTKLSGLTLAVLLSNYTNDVRVLCAAFCLGEVIYYITLTAFLRRHIPGITLPAICILALSILLIFLLFTLYQFGHQLSFELQFLSTLLASIIVGSLFCTLSSTCRSASWDLLHYLTKLPAKIIAKD
jgi:O-antigen/teichoic acid export membrane protein